MLVDAALTGFPDAAAEAARLEALGYDGAFSFEGPHDPFFPLVQAAAATERITLYPAVAIAFARNPMLLAQIAQDLQTITGGRFLLGLGTQIRAHIERRFGMPWSRPAARLREMVIAVREIWRCWSEGGPLAFEGEFYRHTLMTPIFDPGPNPHGDPPIFLAGVGPRVTEVAGEVADGFFVHPLNTERSLRSLTLPALARGLERSGRTPLDLCISLQLMVASGTDDEQIERAREAARTQIAFYASTPAYRVILDEHGLGELQPELRGLSLQGRWDEMARCVGDDVLEQVAVCAPLDRLAERVRARCRDEVDRVSLIAPGASDHPAWQDVVRALQRG